MDGPEIAALLAACGRPTVVGLGAIVPNTHKTYRSVCVEYDSALSAAAALKSLAGLFIRKEEIDALPRSDYLPWPPTYTTPCSFVEQHVIAAAVANAEARSLVLDHLPRATELCAVADALATYGDLASLCLGRSTHAAHAGYMTACVTFEYASGAAEVLRERVMRIGGAAVEVHHREPGAAWPPPYVLDPEFAPAHVLRQAARTGARRVQRNHPAKGPSEEARLQRDRHASARALTPPEGTQAPPEDGRPTDVRRRRLMVGCVHKHAPPMLLRRELESYGPLEMLALQPSLPQYDTIRAYVIYRDVESTHRALAGLRAGSDFADGMRLFVGARRVGVPREDGPWPLPEAVLVDLARPPVSEDPRLAGSKRGRS